MKEVLRNLPRTLDETYERMLTGIGEMYHEETLRLLRWLVYARSSPSIGELVEAAIVDPTGDGFVDVDDRGDMGDTIGILSGLITAEECADQTYRDESDDDGDEKHLKDLGTENSRRRDSELGIARYGGLNARGTRMNLAHCSAKEYLRSDCIFRRHVKAFPFRGGQKA